MECGYDWALEPTEEQVQIGPAIPSKEAKLVLNAHQIDMTEIDEIRGADIVALDVLANLKLDRVTVSHPAVRAESNNKRFKCAVCCGGGVSDQVGGESRDATLPGGVGGDKNDFSSGIGCHMPHSLVWLLPSRSAHYRMLRFQCQFNCMDRPGGRTHGVRQYPQEARLSSPARMGKPPDIVIRLKLELGISHF
jgi:hypothetical protein